MKRKPVFDIRIEANGPAVQMKGESAEVVMIPFKGTVKSEIFNGIVEPCGGWSTPPMCGTCPPGKC